MESFFKVFSNQVLETKEHKKVKDMKQKEIDIQIDKIYNKYVPLIALDILSSKECLEDLSFNNTYRNDSTFLIRGGFQTSNMVSFLDEMETFGMDFRSCRFEKFIELIVQYINDNYVDIKATYDYYRFEISPVTTQGN